MNRNLKNYPSSLNTKFGHFRWLFCRVSKEIYKDFERVCAAVVQIIKTFLCRDVPVAFVSTVPYTPY